MTLTVDAFLLLGCDSASLDNWYTTFRDNLVGSFARAEVYRNEYDFSLDMATLGNDTIIFSRKIGETIIQGQGVAPERNVYRRISAAKI